MKFPGFCGPSYQSQSPNVDAERCVNLYPERCEIPGGKTDWALYPSPGLKVFATLPGENFVSGLYEFNGRVFAGGANCWELTSDGTPTNRGALGFPDGKPIGFAANQGNQLLMCSGGRVYLMDLIANIITQVDPGLFVGPVSQIGFVDGLFAALISGTNKFQISALLDGATWSGLDVNIVEVFPENIVSMLIAFRQMWFLGSKKSSGYQNTGDPDVPFLPVPGGFVEQGSGAQFATVLMDNSPHWLSGDERGNMMAFRANGYTPARISNHAVENLWQGYSVKSDAIGYAFQDQGHTFWHIYFPTAKKSWRYDAATQLWHEVQFIDGTAHRSRSYCFGFGKHLVGDHSSGTIYEMHIPVLNGGTWDFATDFGQAIQRLRQSPHICNEQERFYHNRFQLDLETGLGPIPPLLDGQGKPRAPQVMLQFSDDGGHAWSNIHTMSAGEAGGYRKRVFITRLGDSRDRIYRTTMTDPIAWRIVAAYINNKG